MSRKAVKETLTLAALKRLLEVKHLVKEKICLGHDHFAWYLYLTNKGLVEKSPPDEYSLISKRHYLTKIRQYSSTMDHKTLKQVHKELHEQKSS